ncbi:hypothetical protein M433DRAFT_132856 [Acidomyces richmondensis BFW]|nr:hypothetical protein M433DRAFT_132856 [Acidomyces richmondensis BFW]
MTALADALMLIGYEKVYHMREVRKNDHVSAWNDLLDKKFGGEGQPSIKRDELEAILRDYDATSDAPACFFVEDLIQAYPTAKIILTTRDEDAWMKSMESTLWADFVNRKEPRYPIDKCHKYCWSNDFPMNGRKFFRDYQDHLRQIAPKDRILEYEVKQGWKHLCEFLGKDIPDQAFPRSDDWAGFKAAIKK